MKNKNQTIQSEIVFVHSLFRSGSTYFYNVLKRNIQLNVYHEPFHEVIAELSSAWDGLHERAAYLKEKLRHDFLEGSYFDEYSKILPSIKEKFDSGMSYDLFFMDENQDSKALKAYIDTLNDVSSHRSVFQCTRTIGRIKWLKSNYESKHIFLLRNPWDQWYSYRVDKYISLTPQLIYSQPKFPSVLKRIVMAYGYTPLPGSNLSAQLNYCYSHPVTPEVDYALFFGLWLYSFVVAKMECDFVFSMDEISLDKMARDSAQASLSGIGLKSVDLHDCKLHRTYFDKGEREFYKDIEESILNIFEQEYKDTGAVLQARQYLDVERKKSFISTSEEISDFNSVLEDASRLRADLFNVRHEHVEVIASLKQAMDDNLKQATDERDEQVADRDQVITDLNEKIASLNYEVLAIINSTSWKITAGPRWLKHFSAKIFRKARFMVAERLGRFLFRNLPFSREVKYGIKCAVYRHAGWLFRGTTSYRIWDELTRLEKVASVRNEVKINHPSFSDTAGDMIFRRKKILVVDATTPTPDRDAGSVTAWFFLKALVELDCDVTFIPSDLKPLGHYTDNLRALGVCCLTHDEIDSVEKYLIKEGANLDFAILYRVHTARQCVGFVKQYAPQAKIIFDTVDLHYLREERQAELSKKIEDFESAKYTKRAEFEMMNAADATIVLSHAEEELVNKENPFLNVFNIPLLLDIPGCNIPYENRRDIVFIGGFLHQPNVDAIKYFVNEIWSSVSRQLPDVNLLVIGANPPEDVFALGKSDDRIKIIGYVENLDAYLNRCRVSIAPLRYGAGIKGKIGTSSSFGVPCVATTLAVEGMGMKDMVDVLVADDAESFADKLVNLYNDKVLWDQISSHCLDFVQRNYSYKLGKARLRRLLNSLEIGIQANEMLDFTEIESLAEFQDYKKRHYDEYNRRIKLERSLIGDDHGFIVKGYCAVCRDESSFHVDFEYALSDDNGNKIPNWRERLVCVRCELNNRVRASIHLFRQECAPRQNSDIYITEQTTPLYTWINHHYTSVVGSEYLGSTCPLGESGEKGVRNESLTALSFESNSFDYILSFDVLEHIPAYQAAIQECARVLRPGGQMIFSVPFSFDSNENIVRARICDDGKIEHLMTPEYHGDPINADGCLCFYHFGWQLLEEFREAGFDAVKGLFFWSENFGYLGREQALFMATKRVDMPCS